MIFQWISGLLDSRLTGFLAHWISGSKASRFSGSSSMARHSLALLMTNQPPRLKISISFGIDNIVIVVDLIDTVSNNLLLSTQIVLPLSTAQYVPTQLNEPVCTLVGLLPLKVLHTFCVIQLIAPTQAQIRPANMCEIGSY